MRPSFYIHVLRTGNIDAEGVVGGIDGAAAVDALALFEITGKPLKGETLEGGRVVRNLLASEAQS